MVSMGPVSYTHLLDRPIAGIYVDEAAGLLFGMDVNADEQIVKYSTCNRQYTPSKRRIR